MIELPVLSPAPEPPRQRRLPPWFQKRLAYDGAFEQTDRLLAGLGLATICRSARCPNISECWSRKAATFLIMGPLCTRNCGYCAVPPGRPTAPPAPDEPQRVATAAATLGLRHVVVTSVDRDDLPDLGAGQFVATVQAIRRRMPAAIIEVLTPDFQGRADCVRAVCDAGPQIFNHNVETVPRLYRKARPGGRYDRCLSILRLIKDHAPHLFSKTGLMVGLGETDDEVFAVMRDLRQARCDILTIGQYLQPSPAHLPVERYVPPPRFADYEQAGREMGFLAVSAGPFVRSSYNAESVFAAMGQSTGRQVSASPFPTAGRHE
jgi:lipoic acid synthetase